MAERAEDGQAAGRLWRMGAKMSSTGFAGKHLTASQYTNPVDTTQVCETPFSTRFNQQRLL